MNLYLSMVEFECLIWLRRKNYCCVKELVFSITSQFEGFIKQLLELRMQNSLEVHTLNNFETRSKFTNWFVQRKSKLNAVKKVVAFQDSSSIWALRSRENGGTKCKINNQDFSSISPGLVKKLVNAIPLMST